MYKPLRHIIWEINYKVIFLLSILLLSELSMTYCGIQTFQPCSWFKKSLGQCFSSDLNFLEVRIKSCVSSRVHHAIRFTSWLHGEGTHLGFFKGIKITSTLHIYKNSLFNSLLKQNWNYYITQKENHNYCDQSFPYFHL